MVNDHCVPAAFLARIVLSTAACGGDDPPTSASSVASVPPVTDEVRASRPLEGTQPVAATNGDAAPGIVPGPTSFISQPFSKE